MNKEKKEIEIFDFKGNDVRTIKDGEEVWFILNDVCKVLRLRVDNTKRGLDKGDISNTSSVGVRIPKVNRGMNLVNESGLYQCIFRSDKKEAKEFTRWVTKEVLPTIRKTGGYISPTKTSITMEEIDDIVSESSKNHQKWLDSRKDLIRVTKEKRDLEEKLSHTIVKDDIVSKEEFEVFQKTINDKMNRIMHNNKSPKALRKELKGLVTRYGKKTNISDMYVWGELYKELGKEYKVSIKKTDDRNKLDCVEEYGLLPEAIDMIVDWIENDEFNFISSGDLFDDESVSLEDL